MKMKLAILAVFLFSVIGSNAALTVSNNGGASNVTDTTATLNGVILTTNQPPSFPTNYFGWGYTNGGTSAFLYTHIITNSSVAFGWISTNLTGLIRGQKVFYTFESIDTGGVAMAASSTNFNTAGPIQTNRTDVLIVSNVTWLDGSVQFGAAGPSAVITSALYSGTSQIASNVTPGIIITNLNISGNFNGTNNTVQSADTNLFVRAEVTNNTVGITNGLLISPTISNATVQGNFGPTNSFLTPAQTTNLVSTTSGRTNVTQGTGVALIGAAIGTTNPVLSLASSDTSKVTVSSDGSTVTINPQFALVKQNDTLASGPLTVTGNGTISGSGTTQLRVFDSSGNGVDTRVGVAGIQLGVGVAGTEVWTVGSNTASGTILGPFSAPNGTVNTANKLATGQATNGVGPTFVADGNGIVLYGIGPSNKVNAIELRRAFTSGMATQLLQVGFDVVEIDSNPSMCIAMGIFSNGVKTISDKIAVFLDGPRAGQMTYGNRVQPMGYHTFIGSPTNLPGMVVESDSYIGGLEVTTIHSNYTTLGFPEFKFRRDPNKVGTNNVCDLIGTWYNNNTGVTVTNVLGTFDTFTGSLTWSNVTLRGTGLTFPDGSVQSSAGLVSGGSATFGKLTADNISLASVTTFTNAYNIAYQSPLKRRYIVSAPADAVIAITNGGYFTSYYENMENTETEIVLTNSPLSAASVVAKYYYSTAGKAPGVQTNLFGYNFSGYGTKVHLAAAQDTVRLTVLPTVNSTNGLNNFKTNDFLISYSRANNSFTSFAASVNNIITNLSRPSDWAVSAVMNRHSTSDSSLQITNLNSGVSLVLTMPSGYASSPTGTIWVKTAPNEAFQLLDISGTGASVGNLTIVGY